MEDLPGPCQRVSLTLDEWGPLKGFLLADVEDTVEDVRSIAESSVKCLDQEELVKSLREASEAVACRLAGASAMKKLLGRP